jgi:hypothetical protein
MSEKVIEIPAIKLNRVTVSIVGQTPLLTNRFGERTMEMIEAKQQKKAKTPKEARNPEQEYMDACHMIAKGVYGFPAGGLKKALVVAGGRFADEKMTHLRGILNPVGDLIEIQGPAPTMRKDSVRLQGGVTSIAYRPQFMPWSMDVPIVYNASMIGEAQIFNLFQIAGFAVGIGAWRPESNGVFGQFTLRDSASVEKPTRRRNLQAAE